MAPAGTPAPVIGRLNAEFVRALKSPDLQEKLTPHGFEVVGNTPEQLAAQMRNQAEKWAKVIKESGAQAD